MAISLPYMEIGADTDRSDGTSRKEKKKESALQPCTTKLKVN